MIIRRRQVDRATFATCYQPFDLDHPATRQLSRLETDDLNVLAFRIDDTTTEMTTYRFVAIRPSGPSAVVLSNDLAAHFNDQLFIQVDAEAVRSYGDARRLTIPFDGAAGQFFFKDRLTRPGVSFGDGRMRYEP